MIGEAAALIACHFISLFGKHYPTRFLSWSALLTLLTFILVQPLHAEESRTIKIGEYGQKVEVTITSEKFRKLHRRTEKRLDSIYIDGQRAIGNDGFLPLVTGIESIRIRWNGVRVPLDKKAYSCIVNCPIGLNGYPGKPDSTSVLLSDDGTALVFIFVRDLGDLIDYVSLTVDQHGHWKRFVSPYLMRDGGTEDNF